MKLSEYMKAVKASATGERTGRQMVLAVDCTEDDKGICEYFGVKYVAPENGDNDLYIGEGASWSKEARTWAVENGIIRGKGYNADGAIDFAWGDNVTREELAVMLQRHYELVRELTAGA